MKKLTILCGLLSCVACDDSRMYLGPNALGSNGGDAGATYRAAGGTENAGSSGGPDSFGGSVTGGGAGPAGGSENGGAGPAGGRASSGGAGPAGGRASSGGAGPTGGTANPNGLNIEGLQRLTVDFGIGGEIEMTACTRLDYVEYALDLANRVLAHQRCVLSEDGLTATLQTDTRVLSEPEMTLVMLKLKQLSLDYQEVCMVDGAPTFLGLEFPDRNELYEADDGACRGSQPLPGAVYVANLDPLVSVLGYAAEGLSIPTDYDKITMLVSPRSDAERSQAEECNSYYMSQIEVDFTARSYTETVCMKALEVGQPSTQPAKLGTQTKSLDSSSLAFIRTQLAELIPGATRDCDLTSATLTHARLEKDGILIAELADSHVACQIQGPIFESGPYVIGLDDLYWTIYQYMHPPL